MSAGAVNIRLGAIVTDFVTGFTQAGAAAGRLTTQLNTNLSASFAAADRSQRVFDRGLGRVADNMQSFGRQASLVTAGIGLLAVTSFNTYAELNALQLGLQNITGSAAGATARFSELREVARLPGLGLEEAVRGDVRLQAVGFSAQTSKRALLEFGNTLALTGGGKFELNSVLTQLTQMGSKAKVLAEDLKPILTSSPAVAKAIKEMFGTVDSEQISAKLTAAGRGPQDFITDLIAKLSELQRVSGGPKNAIENLGDAIKIAQFEFGKAADASLGLTTKLDSLGNFVGGLATSFSSAPPAVQALTLGLIGVAAAVGPLSIGIGTLINLGPTFVSGFGAMKTAVLALASPLGAVLVTVAAVTAVVALSTNAYRSYSETLITTANRAQLVAGVNDKVSESIAGEQSKLNSLLAVARDETISKKARLQAVSDLNAISPQYLGNLRLETINTTQATNAIAQYTNALTLKAKVQILSQQSAEAQLAADRAAAKSAKDYVDRSRFSGDVIATRFKASFALDLDGGQKEQDRLLDELGKKRQAAEIARTKDVAAVLARELKNAYVSAKISDVAVDAPKLKPFDYRALGLTNKAEIEAAKKELKTLQADIAATTKSVGISAVPEASLARVKQLTEQLKASGGSAIKNARAELKKLKEEIQSIEVGGGSVPAQLRQRYEELSAQVASATASTAKQKVAIDGVNSSLTVNERILKRLTTELKNQGSKAPESLKAQVAAVKQLVEQEKNLTNFKPVDLGDKLKGISTIDRTRQALTDLLEPLNRLPGLARRALDIKLFGTLPYIQDQVNKLKASIAVLSLDGLVPSKDQIAQLAQYGAQLKRVDDSVTLADVRVNNESGGTLPQVDAVLKMIDRVSAAKDIVETSVGQLVSAMVSARESLKQAGVGLLSGLGESIGRGENPLKTALKSILDILGGFLIQLGTALLFSSAALLAAAPLSFGITLAPGLSQQLAGAGLIVGGGLVKGFAATAFAGGGIISGPTLGLMGEYAGARNNPEVIAPLDKLRGMIGGNRSQVFIPDINIDGSAIRIVLDRSDAEGGMYR